MTAADVLDRLQRYELAEAYGDWSQVAAQAAADLQAAGVAEAADMVTAYEQLLTSDITAGTYDNAAAAIANNVHAVTSNLDNILNPPVPPQ